MEDIEYLEEYEDFILPSGNNFTSRLSVDRTSMDSLDGIYKELIADTTLALPEEPTVSQFSAKPNTTADITPPISKLSVGLLPKSLTHSSKSSTNPAPTTYLSTITTIEPPKTPAYKLSTFNRNNSSVLQRSDKLKSVATVKPTLQRISNPAKQGVRNNTPPLKSNTMGHAFQNSPLVSSTPQTVVASVPKSSAQHSKTHNAIVNPFHGSEDPLNLDSGFLNFAVDKHGLVDDFDFDSDLDNSIIGGISDLDSVDFSDEFSEGNFDLDSDMSSESSDGKKRTKKKKPQELSTRNLKNKPAASTAKQEHAKDQMSTTQNKRTQQVKVSASELNISEITADKRTDQPAVATKKDVSVNAFIARGTQPVSYDKMPKLQPQELSDTEEKLSHIVPTSNATTVVTNIAAATKDTDGTASPTYKEDLHFLDSDYFPSVKRDTDKTYANKKRLSNNEDTTKANESTSDNTAKRNAPEPSSLKSPLNTDHANIRGAATADKNVRIKFGSMCLKSIKPPVCKDPIAKKIPEIDVPTASPQSTSIVNRGPQTDAASIVSQSEPERIVKEVSENETSSVKRIPHDAPITELVAKSTPQKDAPIVTQNPNLVVKKTTQKDASIVPQHPDSVVKKTTQNDTLIIPQFPDVVVKKITQKDVSIIPQFPDIVVKKICQKDASIFPQYPDLVVKKITQKDASIVQKNPDLIVKEIPQSNDLFFPNFPNLIVKKIPNKDAPTVPQQPDLVAKKIQDKCTPTVAEQSNEPAGASQLANELLETKEMSEPNALTDTIPELNASLPCKENEAVFVAHSESAQPNTPNKECSPQKSTITQDDDKVTHCKTTELESSEELTGPSVQTVEGVPAEGGNKDLPSDIPNQSDVFEDSERVVFSTVAAPQRRFGRFVKGKNRLKKNIQKIQQKESTIDNKKTPPMQYKFQARSFNIRLNKNVVAKFIRSSKVPEKSKASTESMAQQQHTESKSKRLQHTSPKAPIAVSVNHITLTTNVESTSARGAKKMSLTELDGSQKASEKSSTIVEEQRETQNTDPGAETVRNTSGKRKKKMTANRRAKMLRRSVKSSPETPDTTKDEISNDHSVTTESNDSGKKPIVKQTSSTDVTSPAKPTVQPKVAGTETEQMEKRHRKANARSTTNESNVGDKERPVEQLPSTGAISSAKLTVRPNVASTETEQMEARHRKPNAHSTTNELNVESTGRPVEQLPATDGLAKPTVRPESKQTETRNRRPNARSTIIETNVRDTETPVQQLPLTGAISSAKPTVRPNVASTETEQMETRHRKPNAHSTTNDSNVEATGKPVEQLPSTDVMGPVKPAVRSESEQKETRHRKPNARSAINESNVATTGRPGQQIPSTDAISSAKATDLPNVASIGVGQMEIRTRRLNARSTVNASTIGYKEQLPSNDGNTPAQKSTNGVELKDTRQLRLNVRKDLNDINVGKKDKRAEQSRSTDVMRLRLSDRHKEDGIRARQMAIRSRRRAALDSSSTDLNSFASGRPMTRRTLKEKLALANKSKKERQLKKIPLRRPAAIPPKVVISFNRKPDTEPPEPTPPELTNNSEVLPNENMASASTSRTESVIDPELDLVRPKTEYTGDTDMTQHQQTPSNSTFDVRPMNTLPNSTNDTQVTVFELPSFIVMKTKIITRRDLRSGRAYIPPLVKQKFNKLAEERSARPVLKTERTDFNDVCTEINALLDRNANYLNFATVAERQTRMNQVLADPSLSVEDAQCALKFLRSYLLQPSAREARAKSKNHLYVPIYDSQRKIIGYRKRISKAKRSIDSSGRPVPQRVANLSTRTSSSAVTNVAINRTRHVPTPCETEVVQRVIQFTAKKEPQVLDGSGNEEIIVPDAAPASGQCIKNEIDSILS